MATRPHRRLPALARPGLFVAFVLAAMATAAAGPARALLAMVAAGVTLLTIVSSLVVVALDVDRRATAAREPEAPAHWATFERAFWEYVEHQRRA